jgi:hypothetical protein
MVLHLFESYMLKDNKFLIFFYFTKEINHFYGPNTSLLFFVKIGIFQMQFAKIINSKKNYQFDFLVIETSLCINFKILSAHFCSFLNKCGPKMAIFSTKNRCFLLNFTYLERSEPIRRTLW